MNGYKSAQKNEKDDIMETQSSIQTCMYICFRKEDVFLNSNLFSSKLHNILNCLTFQHKRLFFTYINHNYKDTFQ